MSRERKAREERKARGEASPEGSGGDEGGDDDDEGGDDGVVWTTDTSGKSRSRSKCRHNCLARLCASAPSLKCKLLSSPAVLRRNSCDTQLDTVQLHSKLMCCAASAQQARAQEQMTDAMAALASAGNSEAEQAAERKKAEEAARQVLTSCQGALHAHNCICMRTSPSFQRCYGS